MTNIFTLFVTFLIGKITENNDLRLQGYKIIYYNVKVKNVFKIYELL